MGFCRRRRSRKKSSGSKERRASSRQGRDRFRAPLHRTDEFPEEKQKLASDDPAFVAKLRIASGGSGCFELALSGDAAFQFTGGAAVVQDAMQQKHNDEDAAKRDDDGGAGGRIELYAEINAQRGNQGAHSPADSKARTDAVGKKHGADARDDEIAEDKQDAGDGHRRSDDKSERSVEKKIPKAHVEAGLLGLVVVHGDEQEFLAEEEVKEADAAVEQSGFDHLRPGDGENIPYEHVLEMLGFAGGLAHQENRQCGGNGISDADEGFLGNVTAAGARKGENGGAEKRKAEADPVSAAAVRVHPGDNGYDGAQRGDLRKGEVHKNNASLDDVHSKIGMDAGENQARQERQNQKRKNLHRILLVCLVKSFLELGDIVVEQFEVIGNLFFAADRGHQDDDLRAGFARDGIGRL